MLPANITNATDRKTICDAACQLMQPYIDAENARQQRALQEGAIRDIVAWCNAINPGDRRTHQMFLSLEINESITTSVLDGWESQLAQKGYIVTRNGTVFKIELPS